MIIAKIDEDGFIALVMRAPVIALQETEFGYAVAAPGEAYYAPVTHPAGGNLGGEFRDRLRDACFVRLMTPELRTLRPTAKSKTTHALNAYLDAIKPDDPSRRTFTLAPGDHPTMIDNETQVVIQAIEEYERPDLREATKPLKLEAMSDALDIVILHAEAARELAEGGLDKPAQLKMHILQCSTALKSCLEMFLRP